MSTYTPTYEKPYPDGWKNRPDKTTPVTAEIMGNYDSAIEEIETYLSENPIESGGEETDLNNLVVKNSISLNRIGETGTASSAVGSGVRASGRVSHAEGTYTRAIGENTHTEGENTEASGQSAHAEGASTTASSYAAHSEGNWTKASGGISHAEGQSTIASGDRAHAEGLYTEAKGDNSHAEGEGTKAYPQNQHVQGKYNIEDRDYNYVHIVGWGTSDSDRKNIHTLDREGNAEFAGNVTNGKGISLNGLKSDLDKVRVIAEGASMAKVFNTKPDLDEWLAAAGNSVSLKTGQNIYIKEKDTPDYWWDGEQLQELETGKIEIEELSYDETMAILNESEVA